MSPQIVPLVSSFPKKEKVPLAIIITGPPFCGMSERMKRTAKVLKIKSQHKVSDLLRATNDPSILACVNAGLLVPCREVNRVLIGDIKNQPKQSRVICGSSWTVLQAQELYSHLIGQRYRIVYIDGMRDPDDCKALRLIRMIEQNRFDDLTVDFKLRLNRYEKHIEDVRRFYRAHLFSGEIHSLNFTDDIDGDCENIISRIKGHTRAIPVAEDIATVSTM